MSGYDRSRRQVCTAVAHELVGIVWAIACEVMNKPIEHAA